MKRNKKSFLWLGFLAIVIILAVAAPGVIPVSRIRCQSQFGPCRKDVEEALAKLSGTSLRQANKQITSLLNSEIFIESFEVRFKLPNNLEVVVIEKKPIYALEDAEKKAIALTDKQGYIVAIVPSTNLPVLKGSSLFSGVSETVSSDKLFALELLANMFQLYSVKEGILDRNSLVIEINPGPRVIFPLQGDKSTLTSSLRLIISKIESEGGRVESAEVDLRFKNPVVTYN